MKLATLVPAVVFPALFSAQLTAQAPAQECGDLAAKPRVACMLDRVGAMTDTGDLAGATPLAFAALEVSRTLEEVGPRYRAHLQTGQLYFAKGDLENAMTQFLECLKIALDEESAAWTIAAKGWVGKAYTAQENYELAEQALAEALALAQAEEIWTEAAVIHANLGEVYLRRGIIGKSQENLRRAIALFLEQEDFERAAEVSGQLADQALEAGDYDNAELYAEQTLQLHSSTEDLPAIARDNQRLARVYAAFDDPEGAIDVTERANGIFERIGDELGAIETLRDFATYYTLARRRWDAKRNADEAAKRLAALEGSQGFEVARDLAAFYEGAGDAKRALAAQKDYVARREAFFDGEKSRALVELTTRFESEFATEQQQRRIEMLEVAEAGNRKTRIFLLVLVALAGALAVNFFMAKRRQQSANALLQSKNDEIGRQKAEIDLQNLELEEKNDNLNGLNAKLVDEMAERESIQKTSFARDRFLATMSHEMRTPINIISGLCHLLLEENPRPDQVEHLRTLQFSANNLVVFINDILDFSKIEAGKLNLEKREFNPERLFREIATRFEQAAKEKDIRATYTFGEDIPACLLGDPARFNQIMTNLVSTSFNHSVNAEVNVSVRAEELTPTEATLRFEIEDDGQVMDEKQLASMFQGFSNNPDDAFEGYNSSDLVLAITRRLVDLQNGHIEVKPREEGGNRFTVLLKFLVSSKQDQRKRVGATKAFEHLAGNSVLLVEDNKINQLVVKKMLTRLGIDVTTADNGVEALEVLNNRTFDLILMDIQMPKMDGYRATAEIRKHINPSVRDVPVVALTASAFLSEREKAKLFGMNDHVGKPFAPEELLDKMTNCLAAAREEHLTHGAGANAALRRAN